MPLKLRDKYTYDQLSLGEIMLRLDPGEGRIRTARQFTVWEGGGEYNVARGLRKCFGLKTAVATAFVDNDVGHLIEDFIMQGGVATDFILWKPDDGTWTVIVMRADGRPGIAVHADLGARMPVLPWVTTGVLVAGVVFLAGGVLLIVGAVRRRPSSTT